MNLSKFIDLYKREKNGPEITNCIPQSSKTGYVLTTVEDAKNPKSSCKEPYYPKSMDEERRKYLERLKNIKTEKIYNDFKPHKRNPNELLLNINEDYIIRKHGSWAELCILDYQDKLLEVIRTNRVVIVKGFTGCGKSTQIPQYIAVDCQRYGQAYNIIVTQPRRVAAMMLASRVASELNCRLGELVGYQIGLDRSRDNKATKILYLTPGVLLQRLILSSTLNFVTHIILDEIHERSADMDMLFLLLKKQIFEQRLNAKIILMSATCDVDLFQEYFTYPEEMLGCKDPINVSPAVFEIYSSRMGSTIRSFRQKLFYLEDIAGRGSGGLKFAYVEDSEEKRYLDYEEFFRANDDSRIIFNREYPMLHRVLYEVVLGLLFHEIEMQQKENQSRGSVLIFLPGLMEIIELTELLRCSPYASRYRWKLYVLHSTLSLKEQTEVLSVAADGSRHIILATNIAESSLTVPNVEFVIDFCLQKTLLACRRSHSMTYLSLEWSSRSSADQRAGRTGRTNHGTVFRLIPRHFYSTLAQFEVPEFERTPLENYVLKAKLIDERATPRTVLAYALSPPRLTDIEAAVLRLKRMSALTVMVTGEDENDGSSKERYDPEDGHLTTLGYMMALLPLDIALSKLVALGLLFDLTYEATVIAAAHCTSGSFFLRQPAASEDPISRYRTQLAWSNRSLSDSLAYLKAYRMYKALEGRFKNNPTLAQRWCQRNGIEYQRLLELETLLYEVLGRLELNMKIEARVNSRTAYPKAEQELLLKVIIAGAFYPNYFGREFVDRTLLERYQSEISLEDTVVLMGFAKDTATTALYIPMLQELYQSCSPSGIDFRVDGGTVFMRLDAGSRGGGRGGSGLSVDSDDHPLYRAYSAHINAITHGWQRTPLKSWSTFAESSLHASVYLALATKRLRWPQVTLSRFPAKVETFYRRRVLSAIQGNYPEGESDVATSGNFTAKISQNVRRYTLPRTPFPATSVTSLPVYVTGCSSPSAFSVFYYRHSYVEKMLANVDLLTQTLHEMLRAQNCQAVVEYSGSAQNGDGSGGFGQQNHIDQCDTGDLVIAPLKLRQHRSIEGCSQQCTITVINGEECIWARAEVVKMSSVRYQKIAFIYYIDFGETDTMPVYCLYPLKCRYPYQVKEETRDSFTEERLEKIDSVQAVHDLLFTIAPLAVQCQLVRVKPSGTVENVGSWAPRTVRYFSDYCARHQFSFRAKIYAQVNERLHVELYPLIEEHEEEAKLSLNELLVTEKLAELKLESDFCQHMSFRRQMNRFHEEATQNNNNNCSSNQNQYSLEAELIFEGSVPLLSQEFTLNLDTIKASIHQPDASFQQQFTQNTFRLRGPSSPLEVKFTGLSRLNATRLAVVSANSINCVALDSAAAASQQFSRLLVAGEVNNSGGGGGGADRLSLANTTLMPALLDFPALMCLLWAPSVELRVNHLLSRRAFGLPEELCGLLAGVGASDANEGASLDPDADIELLFDSTLTAEDLQLVGLLRYQISQFFYIKGRHISLQTNASTGFRRLQSSLSIDRCLGRRQQACRRTLLHLLTRTRLARHWFERSGTAAADASKTAETSSVSPTYRWNMFADSSWSLVYRPFDAKPSINEELLQNLDLKTAVLAPISVPILSHQSSSTSLSCESQPWEEIVLANLDHLEADNLQACQDPKSGLYVCKLCMVCTVTGSELKAHCCATLNTAGHQEASRLFRQYYLIWREERQQVATFAEEALKEEMAEERLGTAAATAAAEGRRKRNRNVQPKQNGEQCSGGELSVVYGERDYQLSVFSDLTVGVSSSLLTASSSALAHISKDLYDAPVVVNQEQLSEHLQRQRECKNPYSITAMKRSLDELSERVSKTGGGGHLSSKSSTVSIYGSAAIEDLPEYFDDDELSLLDSMHLLTAFKKPQEGEATNRDG